MVYVYGYTIPELRVDMITLILNAFLDSQVRGSNNMPMAGSSLHRSKTSCKMSRRDIGGILKSRGEDLGPLKSRDQNLGLLKSRVKNLKIIKVESRIYH